MRAYRAWPNGKKVAVSVTVMFETWSDEAAPNYSVQATSLKSGTVDHAAKAWSTYGGRVGVWRLNRLLTKHGIRGTFFTNGRCAELYPDAVRQLVASGHDLAAHSYTHDSILAYMSLDEQREMIRRSVGLLEDCTGRKVKGWGSPAVAFTPETAGFLAQQGLSWTCDITYVDLPIRIRTAYGDIAGVPTTDFSDNRVLKANTWDLADVYKGMMNYLRENEPMSMLTMVIHCQFGGRPLVSAVIDEILKYFKSFDDVWFATHDELAQWALEAQADECTYADRYFNEEARARA
ncbi:MULTISPECIES: polysaccharide deacetylase family protein [Chelativorans]|jgi:peptidoglycan/xylan/chitin deacetylase (PgdA/CDA1 family)|uniref:Chitooligosaccharide deacetylase n=1 Tax=Chelativorans sp. (strain BNC1) TaxID=266779 RepID=Q11K76_CHESB|nr:MULTISPECIES: polysaccharide deacetylase family protein [Chelativorans]